MAEKRMNLTGNQLAQLANQESGKLNEINRRISSFQNFRNELTGAKDALEEISKNEKGEKILVNLGAGIFVQASLEENAKAITSIAGNVFKEKPSNELAALLEKKIQSLDKSIGSVIEQQQKTASRLSQLEQILAAGRQVLRKEKEKNK